MKRSKLAVIFVLLLSLILCACDSGMDVGTQEPTKGEDEMNTEEKVETPKGTKYFTLSFDDGITQDKKLVEIMRKYNVDCCTFNINTGLYGANWTWVADAVNTPGLSHRRLTRKEIQTGIYDGFELAAHTMTHVSLKIYDNSPEDIIREVQKDADNIEKLTGVKTVGMAWPGGDTEFTDVTVELVKEHTDIKYARCTTPTYTFELPERFLKWYPTCSFSDSRVFELAEQFIAAEATEDMLFYVWGHSYEMDIPNTNSYAEFEQLIKMISEADDIVLVTNAEFYELYKDTIPS